MKINHFLVILCLLPGLAAAQDSAGTMSLRQCLDHSLENNAKIQKDRLAIESAAQSKREVVGGLLPQIGASGSSTYNIQKTTFAMPNFVNKMMPESMQDPNAPKYMTVTMGMDLSANWGFSLTQQLVNFSLFNAVSIAKSAEEMSEMGLMADSEELIAQTTSLYYNAQVIEYSIGLFDESLAVIDRMARIMEANRENGLVRDVDAKRIEVTRMNMETERSSLVQALEVQKNLLKLQMGFPMGEDIRVELLDQDQVESMIFMESMRRFSAEEQTPYRMLKQQQSMLQLQKKAARSELLPVVMLNANYSQNYMGDHFYGETYHRFPVSMISLNFKVPVFSGFSKNAKIKKAGIELQKSIEDERALKESLTMGYSNARMQMDQNRSSIISQKRNQKLAQEVLDVTESNYKEGLSSLTDVLNATSSLVQAQMNYVNALNSCVKAYIDLKKAEGTINELIKD